ncbi:MAG: RES domain-containing protein [Actinobacteria bacterium]|nr:RES domain-containing protein [Actinomycetota bacterium]
MSHNPRGVSLAPPEPLLDLADFPAVTLRSNQRFFRCSRSSNGPWWFASTGAGRFDLNAPRGTCYLATDPVMAVVEALGPTAGNRLVTPEWLEQRTVRLLRLPRPVRVANATDRAANGFGVTLEISTIVPYAIPRAWATALDDVGFGGIAYLLRHSSSPERGIALFGTAGERTSWRRGIARSLDRSIVRALERHFAITVSEIPSSRSLTFANPPERR